MFVDLNLPKYNSKLSKKNMLKVNQEKVSIETFKVNTITA